VAAFARARPCYSGLRASLCCCGCGLSTMNKDYYYYIIIIQLDKELTTLLQSPNWLGRGYPFLSTLSTPPLAPLASRLSDSAPRSMPSCAKCWWRHCLY